MDEQDLIRLTEAVKLLENPDWATRITNLIGMPIEWAVKSLPKGASDIISRATMKALEKALGGAVLTMDPNYRGSPFRGLHRGAVILFGGLGGFFGLPGLAVELPISTVLMFRSIADIARSEGENIGRIETQLACIQVFALGGTRRGNDAVETGYYALRVGLAKAVSEAGEYIVQKGLVEEGAPVIVRLLARIAVRFDAVVTEKAAAEIIPVIGAAGGAAINLLFIHHFQKMARGHFMVRSLERKYGQDIARKEYEKIAKTL